MALELTGKIQQILPQQSGTGKNGQWTKQDFIIETNDQYPRKVCFTAWGEKAQPLGNLQPGTAVKVFFNAESREFNGKWYTDLRIWKLEPGDQSVSEKPVSGGDDFGMEPLPPGESMDNEPDDLPF